MSPSSKRVRGYVGLALSFALALIVLACTAPSTQAQDAPGKAVPGAEKYDMPNGFPAVITYCLYGTRLFESHVQGNSAQGPAVALTSRPDDPSCQK